MAVRAVAFMARSWWGGQPHRRVAYDAWWGDDRVETGVSPSSVMRGRHPADAADFTAVVNGLCPEVGAGLWCDEHGRVVDGPAIAPTEAGSSQRPRGEPREFGGRRHDPAEKQRRTGRLVAGLVALVLGVALLLATSGEGAVALAGGACLLVSVGLLADFVPRERWWW